MAKAKKSDVEVPEKKKETTMEFIASMASILVVGLFIITFCLQAFEIPSSSMENTLLIGDHVFVDRVTPAPRTKWFPFCPSGLLSDSAWLQNPETELCRK